MQDAPDRFARRSVETPDKSDCCATWHYTAAIEKSHKFAPAHHDSRDDAHAVWTEDSLRCDEAVGQMLMSRVLIAQRALAVVGWLLAGAVLAQIFLAGRAVFVGPDWWAQHRAFVHTFEWLSPLAVVLAYLARAARSTKGLAWLTVVLLFMQYATAGSQSSLGRLGLAALHPVGAALFFWTAVELARRARPAQPSNSSSTTARAG
jgi:hypothetical protein